MNDSQRIFFNNLKTSLPRHLNMPLIVSQILEISLNEAYKKIKGSSSLSLQQLTIICDKLRFSYHYQPYMSDTIPFYSPRIDPKKSEMESYLYDMLENLQAVHSLDSRHIKVTTDDIPLFHFFKYPELTAFKLYFWADSMGSPKGDFNRFELSEELKEITKKLNLLYLEIPSTEIWSKDTIQGTIEQVKYAYEAGYLKDNQRTKIILEQLKLCLKDVNSYAINAKKTSDAKHSFEWYSCDVLGSICYLVEGNGTLTSFNRFNTFNYIKTQNINFCSQTDRWMEGLIKKSLSFSGNGEKERNKYLNNAYFDIESAILQVQGLVMSS